MINLEEFQLELEDRLLIEKENIVQELSSININKDKLGLLSKFNEKYRQIIQRLAQEQGVDLQLPYQSDISSTQKDLSNEQIILGKTMNIYDKLVEELYEEITKV